MSKKMKDYVLERYLLGEYSPTRIKKIRASLSSGDKARLDKFKKDNQVFFRVHSQSNFRKALAARSDEDTRTAILLKKGRGTGRSLYALIPLAAVLMVVFLLPLKTGALPMVSRIKGRADTLTIYLKQGDDFRPVDSGEVLMAGDCVQLSFSKGDLAYAAIVSIDGTGAVTRHFPLSGDTAGVPGDEEKTLLPNSFTLDDAPDFEKFYLFRSDKDFALNAVYTYVQEPDVRKDSVYTPFSVTEFVVFKADLNKEANKNE